MKISLEFRLSYLSLQIIRKGRKRKGKRNKERNDLEIPTGAKKKDPFIFISF
jgi:hypothetical protein